MKNNLDTRYNLPGKYICPFCKMKFRLKYALEAHKKRCKNDIRYK